MAAEFLTDVETLRTRARAEIEKGPITEAYLADRERVIEVLNAALATEIVCWLRYKRHHFMSAGINEPISQEFLVHATEEAGHVDQIATRITQLRGEPDFDPAGLTARSHAEYVPGTTLEEMVTENLVAERIAIATYQEIARWLAEDDPTTRGMIESILAVEEEHADDLLGMLEGLHRH